MRLYLIELSMWCDVLDQGKSDNMVVGIQQRLNKMVQTNEFIVSHCFKSPNTKTLEIGRENPCFDTRIFPEHWP